MIRAPCNFEAARGDVGVLLKRTKPKAPSGIASARGIIFEVIPALAVRIADLGITIAGQIHKITVVYLIEIDGGRFSRRTGHTGKVLAVAQLVDEAGLAHVGTA